MKKLAVIMLFVCSVAFAQQEYGSSLTAPNTEKAVETESSPQPAEDKKAEWNEEWEKRRHSVSLFVGYWPLSAWLNILVSVASDGKKDPDMVAYSVAYGYEVYRWMELGLMVDYTTVTDRAVFTVIPRIKFNYINRKYFRMYAYVGFGGLFWKDGATIMANVGYLGVEVGSPVSFFAECGAGQVGMFAAGIKLAF